MLTVKGKLIHGVQHEGAVHTEFEMREATVRDAINAVDKLIDAGDNLSSNNMVRIYTAADQLLSLGSLPKNEITASLLLDLPEDDLEPIFDAQDALVKKRKDAKKK
jgi:hypothetical protein